MTLRSNEQPPLQLSRRSLMGALAGTVVAGTGLAFSTPSRAGVENLKKVKALVFDVYGTCTDYWTTFQREAQAINRRDGLTIDWEKFAAEWRGISPASLTAIYKGERPWESFAKLRRDAFDSTINALGIKGVTENARVELNSSWQRLDLWPDTLPAMQRLKRKYALASLANADMSDTEKLSKNSGLPWDLILTAELVQSVKPDPKVYQLAPKYLGVQPDEILMVACHKADLRGAASQGLRTAFVARPLELGSKGTVDTARDDQFDLNVRDFNELADSLQA
jgi:2-haloacid dehalogenase